MYDNDSIFQRFQGRTGAIISSAPIEGLWLGLKADFAPLLAGSSSGTWSGFWKEAPVLDASGVPVSTNYGDTENVYDYIQFGAGYQIANIGHIRAQIIGGPHSMSTRTPNELGVAFAFTMIEGLTVDFGVKIPFAITDKDDDLKTHDVYQKPFHAALGASFTLADFNIVGRVDGDFAGNTARKKVDGGAVDADYTTWTRPQFNIHLVPSYDLGFAVVGLELGTVIYGDTDEWKDGSTISDYKPQKGGIDFGFGLWIQKKMSNGSIKAGVAYKIPTVKYANYEDESAEAKLNTADGLGFDDTLTRGVFSIPVILEFSF
jgi:hypothetical protein